MTQIADVRREGNGYYNDFKYSHDTKKSMPFPAPNAVYVDNKNKPAHP